MKTTKRILKLYTCCNSLIDNFMAHGFCCDTLPNGAVWAQEGLTLSVETLLNSLAEEKEYCRFRNLSEKFYFYKNKLLEGLYK